MSALIYKPGRYCLYGVSQYFSVVNVVLHVAVNALVNRGSLKYTLPLFLLVKLLCTNYMLLLKLSIPKFISVKELRYYIRS